MSSGNAVRGRLSLLLVALMIMPSSLAIFSYQTEKGNLSDENRMNAIDYVLGDQYSLGETGSDDPSHGWKGDSANIGEASLFYRTATFVPIE